MSSTDALGDFIDGYRRQIKAIAEEIRNTPPVEVEAADGTIKVTALATGQLTDLYLGARARYRCSTTRLLPNRYWRRCSSPWRTPARRSWTPRPLIGDATSFDEIMKPAEAIGLQMKQEEEERAQAAQPIRRHTEGTASPVLPVATGPSTGKRRDATGQEGQDRRIGCDKVGGHSPWRQRSQDCWAPGARRFPAVGGPGRRADRKSVV